MRLSRSGVLLAGSAGRDIRFAAPPPPYSKVPSVSQTAAAPVPALDPVPLAQALIRCPSVTPEDKEIGRAHVWTPVTNAHLVCRLLLEKKKNKQVKKNSKKPVHR